MELKNIFKVKEKKPLTAIDMYYNKLYSNAKSDEDVVKSFVKNTIECIRVESENGKLFYAVQFNVLFNASIKQQILKKFKEELKFKILYSDSDVILLSWKLNIDA